MFCTLSVRVAQTSFSTFSVFIPSGKNANHYEIHVIFQDIELELQDYILHHFLHYSFLQNLN